MGFRKWMGAGVLLLGIAPVLAQTAPTKTAQTKKAIVVDWDAGLVYPLEDGDPVHAPIITNNRKEFTERDLGTFSISEKVEDKHSNLYNIHGKPLQDGDEPALMRHWMRLGYTAQGFHQSPLFRPDGSRHQSHGCYRLSRAGANWLYHWAEVGTPVHVVRRLRQSRYAWLLDTHPREASVPSAPRHTVHVAERAP